MWIREEPPEFLSHKTENKGKMTVLRHHALKLLHNNKQLNRDFIATVAFTELHHWPHIR